MKRRFANQVEGDYFQDRMTSKHFTGYICYIKIKNVEKPLILNNGLCLKDNGYEWFELYPDEGNYVLTIMFDDKNNLIEWYFDIAQKIGVENGIPFEDDLYLDMIITPHGKSIVIDEDELLAAEKNGDISHKEVEDAYQTLEYLKTKYVNHLDELKLLTEEVKKCFY